MREAISYVFDDFRLDVKRQELQRGGSAVPLTHKAYRVLHILVQNSEQTVEKEYIYKELWGDSFVEDANLTQHIYILRKTLGQSPAGDSYIETVSRTGYRFTAPARAVYPPQVAEGFFKPKTGVEPALDLQPRFLAEPHLKLAELKPAEATEPEELIPAAAAAKSVARTGSLSKRAIVFAALVVVAVAVAAVIVYWRTPTTSNPAIRSVAVLPFKPIGEETRNERLGLGMADAIITNLTKLRQIPVRPTSSVIRYIDAPQNNSVAAGSELGVDTVVEGTVQLADERVRVSVQLIDVAGGKAIWAENFDEPFTGIFEVQDSISRRVVRSIAANFTQADKQPSGGTTTNFEAMKAYQIGVYLHSTRTKDNLFKAEEYFKEAVANDPNFAKAYAMLADTYNMQRYYRFADPRDTRAKGLDAASRALELDSSTPEAYIAMANLQVGGKDGIAGSKRLLEKAIELSPYNATARLRYAWVIVSDDLKAASEQMRLAQEYDPVSPISNGAYCNILIFERRFQDALPFCEKAADLNPTSTNSQQMLSDVYMFNGRVDDAIAKVRQRISQTESEANFVAQGSLALYLIRAGRRAEAQAIIAKLKPEVDKYPELLNDLTVLHYELGDRETGFKYFKSAYETRQLPGAMVQHYPVWEKVVADPEVQKILTEPGPPPSVPRSNSNK